MPFLASFTKLTSLPLSGACLDSINLNLENGDFKDPAFIKLVDDWEKAAPTGEDRRQVAIDIKDASAREFISFDITDANITELPPLPRTITELTLRRCENLEQLNGDLSHLSKLNVYRCGIKILPDNLTNLLELRVSECNSVERLLITSSQLTFLCLFCCRGIIELSSELLPLLESVEILSCPNLTIWSGELPSLKKAEILVCTGLTTWSCSVPKLIDLNISTNPKLMNFPVDLPVNLNFNGERIPRKVLYSSQIKRSQQEMQQTLSKFSKEQIGEASQHLIGTNEAQSYRQQHPRSCGAASLFFIARDLGLKKNPLVAETLKNFPVLSETYPRYHENLPLQFISEEDLYKITSGFDGDIDDIGKARGSWPHNIILAAKGLGLEAELYVEDNKYHPTMLFAKTTLFFSGIVSSEQKPQLSHDELEMKLLSRADSSGNIISGVWDQTLHWVVSRPDGSFMDPGMGQNFNSLSELCAAYAEKEHFVVDAGMSIVLKNGSSLSGETESICTLF